MPSAQKAPRFFQLDNGVRLAIWDMPGRTSVAAGLWTAVGGRHEAASESGASHFIEHLVFKGTRRRSALRITQDVEGLGGQINAYTSEDHTCYFARCRTGDFTRVFDVLADLFLNSTFPAAEIDKERQVIKEEIAMYRDQPQQHVLDLASELLWPRHPLGRCLLGTPRSLDGLSRSRLLDFRKRHYTGPRTWITVAGRFRLTEVLNAAREFARRLPSEDTEAPPPPAPVVQTEARIRWLRRRTEQTQLALAFRAFPRAHPSRHALRLLHGILGENMSSRLFQEIREKHGLAYAIGTHLHMFADDGAIVISAGLDDSRVGDALDLTLRELRRLRRRSPGKAELDRAREYVLGHLDLLIESTENSMLWLGEQLLQRPRPTGIRPLRDRLAKVTPEDVRQAAATVFHPDRISLAVISPAPAPPDLAHRLRILD